STGLAADFARFRDELRKLHNNETSSLHRAERRARLRPHELDHAEALLTKLLKALAPLEEMSRAKPHDFAELAQRHRDMLVNLCVDEHGVATAFEGQDGIALAAAFDDLLGRQENIGLMVAVN